MSEQNQAKSRKKKHTITTAFILRATKRFFAILFALSHAVENVKGKMRRMKFIREKIYGASSGVVRSLRTDAGRETRA